MNLDLNNCFPAAPDGSRGPLPKQQQFIDAALDPKGPKYIAYVGGIGSGKTLIGCIQVLTWAILFPGDYLISRLYLPELKITTLKTFKEICPPELIAEERVADGIIRIKAVGGKVSNIIFRGLDEPDKLRSLNLSGVYIDESSQVSEAAFMLLQGRLRGAGLRKMILTSNPNGHDWIYMWWVKQDHLKTEEAKQQFKLIKAPSTENTHLPEGYVQSMMDTWSDDRIQREIYGSFDSFSGQVYSEFRRDVHVIHPFKIPKEWPRMAGADHGFRAPAAWVWGAQDYDGNVYIYREFYQREWLIEEICRGKDGMPGIRQLTKGETLTQVRLDPSTRAHRGATEFSDWDIYLKHLPENFPLMLAKNDKTAGIDKVKSYLKVQRNGKPKLFIFSTCVNLIEEITQYRYQELRTNQIGKQNEKEDPVKVNDHAADALRYLVMELEELDKPKEDIYQRIKYASLEGALHREMNRVREPKAKDPWGDRYEDDIT